MAWRKRGEVKIAVCVKEVPGASAARRIDPTTKRLVREGDQVLNPFDGHAIEAAARGRRRWSTLAPAPARWPRKS